MIFIDRHTNIITSYRKRFKNKWFFLGFGGLLHIILFLIDSEELSLKSIVTVITYYVKVSLYTVNKFCDFTSVPSPIGLK
jgi:hypothetical protein